MSWIQHYSKYGSSRLASDKSIIFSNSLGFYTGYNISYDPEIDITSVSDVSKKSSLISHEDGSMTFSTAATNGTDPTNNIVLYSNGQMHIISTALTSGIHTMASDLSVGGDTNIVGEFSTPSMVCYSNGQTHMTSTALTTGIHTMASDVKIGGDLDVSGSFDIGSLTIDNLELDTLTVSGNSSIDGRIVVGGLTTGEKGSILYSCKDNPYGLSDITIHNTNSTDGYSAAEFRAFNGDGKHMSMACYPSSRIGVIFNDSRSGTAILYSNAINGIYIDSILRGSNVHIGVYDRCSLKVGMYGVYLNANAIMAGNLSVTDNVVVSGDINATGDITTSSAFYGAIPWMGPCYSGNDMDDGDNFFLNSASGYKQFDFRVPTGMEIVVKGCILTADDQASGESFRIGVLLGGGSSKNTDIKAIANWGTYDFVLSEANYVTATAGTYLRFQCKYNTDNTIDPTMVPYGTIKLL